MSRFHVIPYCALSVAAAMPGLSLAQPASETERTLEEIVVTSQKVSESLKDVPISVAVATAQDIKDINAFDFKALQDITPGVNFGGGAGLQSASIQVRGVGPEFFALGAPPAVAVFVDQVGQAQIGSVFSTMVDIERIELLRGPQGTLYGLNAPGGAYNISTRNPDHNGINGYIEGSYSLFDSSDMATTDIRGAVNIPLVPDQLAWRVAGVFSESDGYVKLANPDANEDTTGGHDNKAIRSKLLWNPTDNMELLWIANYSDLEQNPAGFNYDGLVPNTGGTPRSPHPAIINRFEDNRNWGDKESVVTGDIKDTSLHFGKKLIKAVKSGRVDEKYIDEAAQRIVSTTLRFDEVLQKNHFDPSIAACEEHRMLARRVAEKSMTLLKNDNGVLPLNRSGIKRLAVLGELADTENVGDHGSSKVVPPYIVTALTGLERYLGEDVTIDYCSGADLTAAAAACSAADAVVLVVGNRHSDEGEFIMNSKKSPGGDRDNLSLRAEEVALIKTASKANSNTVAVLIGGSAITISEWDQDVASILFAYYPGMEGGNALANTLFGEVNPGGKLPFTIPTDAAHLPFFDKDAESIEYGYYHGYTLLDKENITPAYAFGFGKSFTRFELSEAVFSSQGETLQAEVTVTNVGHCEGDEVVQLYVGCSQSSVDRPKKLLRGFKRISLQPGQSIRVTLNTPFDSMRWYDEESTTWKFDALPYELYIGTSSADRDLITGVVKPDTLGHPAL